jgi:tetratricopeptide (TPR) repeat protein
MRLADLSAGVVLGGRFRLQEILGRGSYGDVWRAEVIDGGTLPSIVAVKIYHPVQQARATRVLFEEALRGSSFDHPRLVRVFAAERIDGLAVMWMEYVPGETLYQRLGPEDSPRPVELGRALAWMEQIADGLAYLHSQAVAIVHGDLKLDNVLLDKADEVRLTDFGQSRTIEDRFVETAGVGAWPYLAPEILGKTTNGRGQRYVSSDVYAWGVIFYRLLTGRFPQGTLAEVMGQKPFPRPRELNPRIPVALEAIVMRCLEKRHTNRFQTGVELLAALQRLRATEASRGSDDVTPPPAPRASVPPAAAQVAELGRRLLSAGRVEEALQELEAALQRMSTAPTVLLVYAEAARAAGQLDTAWTVYRRVRDWLEREGRSDEELRDTREGLAELDVRLKNYEDAATGFTWLAERWPDNVWYRYRQGVSLGLVGRCKDSIEVLRRVQEELPRSAAVCAKIGFAYLQLRDAEQAAQYFNEALMLDAYEPFALFHMARLRWVQGYAERARGYMQRLREVDGAADLAEELACLLGES